MTFIRAILGVALLTWTGLADRARAQEVERRPCPDIEATAAAAEHARCWFDRLRADDAGCAAAAGVDGCAQQAAAWCDDGDEESSDDVDLADQTLANVCVVSLIRALRFDRAAETARYVRDVFPEARACVAAASGGLRVRVEARGEPARVRLDGRDIGRAPLEVALGPRWWERSIAASGRGTSMTWSADQIRRSFDPTTCTMRDLVLEPRRDVMLASRPADASSGGATPLGWTLVVGGAVLSTGGAVMLGIAASDSAAFDSHGEGTAWSDGLSAQHDRVVPLQVAGGVALGIGVVTGVIGALVLAGSGSRSDEARERSSGPGRAAMRTVRALQWRF